MYILIENKTLNTSQYDQPNTTNITPSNHSNDKAESCGHLHQVMRQTQTCGGVKTE